MRIAEEIRKQGFFWLPENAEKRLPGVLRIADGGDIFIEVVGLFDESIEGLNRALNGDYELGRVVGHVDDYGAATFDGNRYSRVTLGVSGGITQASVRSTYALLGAAYDQSEPVTFRSFRFSVDGLEDWVNVTGIKSSTKANGSGASITYRVPADIDIGSIGSMNLRLTFGWTVSGLGSRTNAGIGHKTYFELGADNELPLENYISAARRVANLVSFAADVSVCQGPVTAHSKAVQREKPTGEKIEWPVKVFYHSLPHSSSIPKVERHRVLFDFQRIASNPSRVFRAWFDAYEVVKPALDLYFASRPGELTYLESRFLALSQGLETYHRRTNRDRVMNETEYQSLVSGLLETCPESRREWLAGRLAYGNEPNLRYRLKKIIEPLKSHFGNRRNRERLVSRIVDTRNYLTHYDEANQLKAASGYELWILCQQAEAVFQLQLLRLLGFSNEEVKEIVSNSNSLQRKIQAD